MLLRPNDGNQAGHPSELNHSISPQEVDPQKHSNARTARTAASTHHKDQSIGRHADFDKMYETLPESSPPFITCPFRNHKLRTYQSQTESRLEQSVAMTTQSDKASGIIRKAEFNTKVCSYWLLSGTIAFSVSIIGIPLLLLWIPLGQLLTRRYLASMECILTPKALKVKKGIFVRIEKTIPLEKITDMGMVQGPIMRHYDLHCLTVETAGQSGPGALVSLTGIKNAIEFRETVLAQRDAASEPGKKLKPTNTTQKDEDQIQLLREIRDSLKSIEHHLNNQDQA
jgi:putative membrane protein